LPKPSSPTSLRASSALARRSGFAIARNAKGNSTFSSAVSQGNKLASWNTTPTRSGSGLSIGASFGALVFIFQQGHFSNLLGFTPQSLDPSIPVILFAIVFGLSMDYEVLLISRIQEEYRRTGDTTQAVADGLEKSGRLITGAAGIMVAVFLAFGLADVVLIKSIGLGLAIAVAIDATLVRALIVPAVMRLLGRSNWWAPRPLARWHRRFSLEGRIAA